MTALASRPLPLNPALGYAPRVVAMVALVVVAVHAALLLGGWLKMPDNDELPMVAMDTRIIEVEPVPPQPKPLVPTPPAATKPQPLKVPPNKTPEDAVKPRASTASPELPPPPGDTSPITVAAPPEPVASSNSSALAVSARAAVAAAATGMVGVSDGKGNITEKVMLTVPNEVRVPDSRKWSFVTTFRDGWLSSPAIPTTLNWKVENGRYDLSIGAGALVSAYTKLSRSSAGTIGEKGLEPERFLAVSRNGKQDASHFVRDKDQITFNNSPAQPLLPGAQDEISTAMQLSAMLGGEPGRYKVGDRMVVQVARKTTAQIWVFNIVAEELVDLPNGSILALKLVRAPREPNDTAVTVWLAPEHQFMMVRLRMDYSDTRSDDAKWLGY